ncbi:MAG: hypothetical protein EAZ99_14595 [Alphaproteobacteria bacterium]|nr:MAG: hypothetical protein EAZ99_14595 [Alphaproteobacteria bacterium]
MVATPAISGEQRVVWSLAEGVRAPPPPKNHLQPAAQRLWGAMRPLRRPFLLAELAGLACVSHRTTAAYIGALAGAGVVRCVQPALRGRPARYELARDLGMVAPSFVRDETGARVLRDNNPQLGTTAAALAAVVAAPSVRGRAA